MGRTSQKITSVLLGIILLVNFGGFPSFLPHETINEFDQILQRADEIGLTEYFPNLSLIMEAEAMGKPEQGNQGQGESQMKFLDEIPTDSTPLQRGLMKAIGIQKFGEDSGKPGNPNPGPPGMDCDTNPGKGNGGRPCDKIPEFVTNMIMSEDLMRNGKKVGLKIMTETIITFDNPGKGPKKANGDFKDTWDDFMIGKLDFQGVGNQNLNSMMESMGMSKKTSNSGSINRANVFPNMAVNDDNDCVDLVTGEIFRDDGCFEANGDLKQTLETFSGGDGFACRHIKINDPQFMTDNPDLILEFRGDSTNNMEDDCFDENNQLKTALVEQIDEDDFDDINLDNDCVDATGKVFGGPAGSANSCFDVDMELKSGLQLTSQEDPEDDVNNDFDCENEDGNRFGGFPPTDSPADPHSCFDDSGMLKTGLFELTDEDGAEVIDNDGDGMLNEDPPENFKTNCEASGGVFMAGPDTTEGTSDDECDMTGAVVTMTNGK